MSKYNILTLWGLKELLTRNTDRLFSPDGNELTAVSNGIFGGNLLYDHKQKKVYGLCLKEVVNVNDAYIRLCEGEYAQAQIKYNMNFKEAIEFLKSKGKWL